MPQRQGLSFSDARDLLLGSVQDAVERVRRLHSSDGKTVPPAPWWERSGAAIAIRPKDFFMEDGAASFADVPVPAPRSWQERLFEGGVFNRFLLRLALISVLAVSGNAFSSGLWKLWAMLFLYVLFSPSIHFLLDTGSGDWGWKKRKRRRPVSMLWFALRESVPCAFACFCLEMIAHHQWVCSGKSWFSSRNERNELRALYEEATLAYRIRLEERGCTHRRIYKGFQDKISASMSLTGVFVNIPTKDLEEMRHWLQDVYEVCLPEVMKMGCLKLAELNELVSHILVAHAADNAEERSRLPMLEAELRACVKEVDAIIDSLDTDLDNALPTKLPNLPPKPEVVHLVPRSP